MQRLKCFAKEQWWYLLAFLLPFLILGGVYALFGMYPFGDKSVLIADLNSQYVDYYSNFRDLLTEGGSLLYNWNAGMGLNYVGILSYYLMSPFSFLILCFSKANITEAIGLMIVLKIGCSGLTFSILAKKKFNFTPVFCLLFSCLYALSSYAVVYTSNPMWLDALILLPLLILSIDAMVQKGKFLPFTVVLFCLFVTNYYISYMVGIFAFLYFLAQSICAKNGLFLRRLGTFFAATLLSVGLAAVVLLPSAMNLFDSYQKVRTLQISFELAMEPAELLPRMFLGSYEDLTYGLPNLYCGLPVLLLLPAYFMNQEIKLREKLPMLGILAVFLFSFLFEALNLAWHLFQRPTWFPYRYSFLFCFTCILLACRCLQKRGGMQGLHLLASALLCGALLAGAYGMKTDYFTLNELLENALFLIIYTAVLTLYAGGVTMGKTVRTAAALLTLCLVLGEAFLNTRVTIADMDQQFHYKDKAYYSDYYLAQSQPADFIKEYDISAFYRVGIDNMRDSNDAMSLGVRGLSHYSSASNQRLNVFLNSLGYYSGFADRYFKYFGANCVNDSLMGVKYVISDGREDFGYSPIASFGETQVYQNRFALPLGYMVKADIAGFTVTQGKPLDQLNRYVSLALGEEVTLFTRLEAKMSGSHIQQGYRSGPVSTGADQVTFQIVNPKAQYVYFYSQNGFFEFSPLVCNGSVLSYPPEAHIKGIVSLGYFEAGETITLEISNYAQSGSFYNAGFYGLNEEAYMDAMTRLAAQPFILSEEPGSHVHGNVTAQEDGLLLLSIPNDPGWSARVDGTEAQLISIADGILALRVTAGQHEVDLAFVPRGGRMGAAVSLVSTGVLLFFIVWDHRLRGQKAAKQTLSPSVLNKQDSDDSRKEEAQPVP